MATLTALASELQLLILSYLPKCSLAALSIASKDLRPLIQPLLYRSVEWTFRQKNLPNYHYEIPDPRFEGEDAEVPTEERGDAHRFILFIRSIVERPALGKHVAQLSMELKCEEEPQPHLFETTDDNQQMFLNEINKMGCGRGDLFDGILRGRLDAATCILLPLIPNLTKLNIEYSLANYWALLGDMILWLAAPTTSGRTLPKVAWKEVSITNRNLDEIENVRLAGTVGPMRSLFYMTSLDSIAIVLPNSDSLFRILPAPQSGIKLPVLPNLRTLRLLNSEANVATLDLLLRRIPNLETLEYNYVQDLEELWYDREHRQRHQNEWEDLTKALHSVASTLKEFIMSVSYHCVEDYLEQEVDTDWVHDVWRRRGRMGSIKPFTNLQRLEVPVAVILGYDSSVTTGHLVEVLPGNLRHLSLRDDLINMWFDWRYEWTPWVCNVVGGRLNESFQQTCDASPLLSHLTEYLRQTRYQVAMDGRSSLETLVLKQSKDRQWPVAWRQKFQDLTSSYGLVGKIHVQLAHDQVKEIIRDEEVGYEKFGYFNERPRALSYCYL